jgi:hypothetical protein
MAGVMPYQPLRLPATMPHNVRDFVHEGIEPSLYDIHSMLRLPLTGNAGCEANCSFSIVMVLVNVVSGCSILLFDSVGGSGKRFVSCLGTYYPWSAYDLASVESAAAAARLVYELFRNPFSHSFGLKTKTVGKGERQRTVLTDRRTASRVAVGRLRRIRPAEGLDDKSIQEIEYAPESPDWLRPTLERNAGIVHINAEPFYRGVRLMIERLCTQPARLDHAARFLASGIKKTANRRKKE